MEKGGYENANYDKNREFEDLVFEGIFNVSDLLFPRKVMTACKDHPTFQF